MATISDAGWEEHQRKFAEWLLDTVGISGKQLESLQRTDDDWTFIVKIHAMLEVALNHMILGRLHHSELAEIVSRLTTHGKTGKMAFVKAFDLLPENGRKFIVLMSEVRRTVVHDVKNFDFDLRAHVKSLDKSKQDNWKTAVTWNLSSNASESLREFSLVNPRFAIFQACLTVLTYSFHAQPERVADLYRAMMRRGAQKPPESRPKES